MPTRFVGFAILLLLLTAVGYAQPSFDVTGHWNWVQDKNAGWCGPMDLIQKGTVVTGTMMGDSNHIPCTVEGTIFGGSLTFTRQWGTEKQSWHLNMAADGKSMFGKCTGDGLGGRTLKVSATRQ